MSERMPEPGRPADAPVSRREAASRSAAPATPSAAAPASGAAVPPAPPLPSASVEAPSADVARPPADSALPGEHRGGFRRELTQPLPIAPRIESHPDPSEVADPQVHWIHPPPALPRSAGWAVLFGILGLVLSFFVGWGFPVGATGAVLAVIALRRPWERREPALWALGLSVASLLFSAGWLWWASTQGPLFG